MTHVIGIGLAFAKLAYERGAKVILGDLSLRPEAIDLVKKGVVFEKCDVTKWSDLENLVKVSEQKFGDVPDIYHANAGVLDPVRSF
jgi:NAD(P)-dependent dehydrogenase (short-subunit alcohol dehydrogenase family)